jgi:hypothetical protein
MQQRALGHCVADEISTETVGIAKVKLECSMARFVSECLVKTLTFNI